jgi:hypothetical protein
MNQLTCINSVAEFRLVKNFRISTEADYIGIFNVKNIDTFNKIAIQCHGHLKECHSNEKKFAWWPVRSNSRKLIWLKNYYMSKEWGYVTENTSFSQADFDSNDRKNTPGWILEIADHIGEKERLSNIMCTITKQNPGNSLPPHVDSYESYRGKKNIPDEDAENIIRYLVFLEDWKIGHFLQFGDSVCCYWKKGDCITWEYGLRHLSTNAGTEPKFAMQITGVKKNKDSVLDAHE